MSIFGTFVVESIRFRSFVLCWCWKDDRIAVEAGSEMALWVRVLALIIEAVLPFLSGQL